MMKGSRLAFDWNLQAACPCGHRPIFVCRREGKGLRSYDSELVECLDPE